MYSQTHTAGGGWSWHKKDGPDVGELQNPISRPSMSVINADIYYSYSTHARANGGLANAIEGDTNRTQDRRRGP